MWCLLIKATLKKFSILIAFGFTLLRKDLNHVLVTVTFSYSSGTASPAARRRPPGWLPSKPKITLANLAKVDKFLLAKQIFF